MPKQQDKYLSELYHVTSLPPNLDLRVRVLNINPGYNEELVASSPYLRGYQIYTDKVRRYSQTTPLQLAVERAMAECIEEGILREFLLENKKEVMDMSIFEFDQEMFLKVQINEAKEDGIQIGLEQGSDQMRRKMIYSMSANGVARQTICQSASITEEELEKILQEISEG